jgi:signal transduction histidine kinase
VGLATNIEKQKQAVSLLEEQRDRFQQMIDALPIMAWAANTQGEITFYNKRCFEYFDDSTLEPGSEQWLLHIHPDDRSHTISEWMHSVKTGEPYNIRKRWKLHENAPYRYYNVQAYPVRDKPGNIDFWMGTTMDVHHYEELLCIEQNLNTANLDLAYKNRRLEQVNHDLDTFVYAASHDLKTPVNNLEALVRMLEAYTYEGEQLELIGLMQKTVNRLRNTISDLTEIIKFNTDEQHYDEPVSIKEITESVLEELHDLVASNQAVFEFDLQVDHIVFSRKYMRSMLYNLLSNAVKYHVPNRPPIVWVSSTVANGQMVLKVSDNGLGIHPKDHDKVFGIFRRLHTHVEGTGIGMYLVKKMVGNAGGSIELNSQVGQGSTFTVCLPMYV